MATSINTLPGSVLIWLLTGPAMMPSMVTFAPLVDEVTVKKVCLRGAPVESVVRGPLGLSRGDRALPGFSLVALGAGFPLGALAAALPPPGGFWLGALAAAVGARPPPAPLRLLKNGCICGLKASAAVMVNVGSIARAALKAFAAPALSPSIN